MHVVYQITFYELAENHMLSAFLTSEVPHPVLLQGDTFYSKDVAGLESFSSCLEIVHTQQYFSTLNRGEIHHQQLVFTRAYNRPGTEIPEGLSQLINKEMMGDT
jgi:hypothetical protein